MKYSEETAYSKLVDWCNKGERCRHDIRQKLLRWQFEIDFIHRCITRLEKSNLIDDERFATAFAHDKSTLQRWGIRKIEQHLKARAIADEQIRQALEQLQADVHDANLKELAARKWPSIKGKNEFERTSKLIQYLMRKGFTYESIKKSLAREKFDFEDINHP
jgi:regulatory protein